MRARPCTAAPHGDLAPHLKTPLLCWDPAQGLGPGAAALQGCGGVEMCSGVVVETEPEPSVPHRPHLTIRAIRGAVWCGLRVLWDQL